MDNLEEMGKFLEMYNHLKVNQEETENMNRPVTEIDSVKKKKNQKPSNKQKFRTRMFLLKMNSTKHLKKI